MPTRKKPGKTKPVSNPIKDTVKKPPEIQLPGRNRVIPERHIPERDPDIRPEILFPGRGDPLDKHDFGPLWKDHRRGRNHFPYDHLGPM